jgi:amino acid transporter
MGPTPERHVGQLDATLIGVGAIVGGGILALAGHALAMVGPAAIGVFALNGVVAYLTVRSFAALAVRYPVDGGAYAFARRVLSVHAAFAAGWVLGFAYIVAGALYAMGAGVFGAAILQGLASRHLGESVAWLGHPRAAQALAVIAIAAYSMRLGRRGAGGGQAATWGKLVVFCVLIAAGLMAMPGRGGDHLVAALSPMLSGGAADVLAAMGLTFIALQGFDAIATVGGQIRDPERVIPRAMKTSLALALVIYLPLLFVISTVGVPPGEHIATMAALGPETVLAESARNFLGETGWWLVAVAAVLSMLSALQANVMAATAVAVAMAGDGTLPPALGRVEPERGQPATAVHACALTMTVVVLAVPNLESAGAAASLIFLVTFALAHAMAWLSGRRDVADDTGSALHLPAWIPVVGGVTCGFLALSQLATDSTAALVAAVWTGVGGLLFRSLFGQRAEARDAFAEAHDPTLALARGRSPLVLVPIANPARAPALLELASAIAPLGAGRVLLLSVAAERTEAAIDRTQHALRSALVGAQAGAKPPEALVTFATDSAGEILRIAEARACESLVLGLSAVGPGATDGLFNRVLAEAPCDVVVLRSAEGFHPGQARRLLIPVGGRGGHDELRARLLGALFRTGDREITFLRVLPATASQGDVDVARRALLLRSRDESPQGGAAVVERTDDATQAVLRCAEDADLLVLGMLQGRQGGGGLGSFALEVAGSTDCASIIIGRRL